MATLAADAPTLEAGESIRAAQDKLRRAVQIANLGDDPLGVVIDAQIAVLGAQQTMISEVKLSLAQTKAPITTDDIVSLNKAAATNATAEVVYAIRHLTARVFWRTALAAGAILIVAILVGAGGGYWFGHRVGLTEVLPFAAMPPAEAAAWAQLMRTNSAVKATESCEQGQVAASDGRRACAMPMWLDPPAAVPTIRR